MSHECFNSGDSRTRLAWDGGWGGSGELGIITSHHGKKSPPKELGEKRAPE